MAEGKYARDASSAEDSPRQRARCESETLSAEQQPRRRAASIAMGRTARVLHQSAEHACDKHKEHSLHADEAREFDDRSDGHVRYL